MKKTIPLILVVMILLSGCSLFKSDEQKMKDQINRFITAYNSGDAEGMIDTLDSQSRQVAKASLGIADSLIGTLTGIGISVKDVFTLCINFSGDFDRLTITSFDDFQILASAATVTVSVVGEKSGEEETQTAIFKMKQENDDWYITDFYGIGGI